MKHSTDVSKYWINSYLCSLIVFTGLLLIGCGVGYAFFVFDSKIVSSFSERMVKFSLYLIPCIAYFAFCVIKSYEIFGRVTVCEDRFIVSAPLRKPLTYMVDEIKCVQIDYNVLSQKQGSYCFSWCL